MKPASAARQPDAVGDGRGDRQMAGAAATEPGGQAHYSDMAIETALMLRLTFHLHCVRQKASWNPFSPF